MAATVTLPGVGRVPRTYLYMGGAAVLGIGAYAWITRGRDTGGEQAPPDENVLGYDAFGNPLAEPGGAADYVPPTTTDPTGTYTSDSTQVTTNAAWTQAATEYLLSLGYNPVSVSSALGKFLARQPLGSVEQDITRAALASQGEPPQGSPWVIIPEQGAAVAVGAVSNLHQTAATSTSVTLGWGAATNATSYRVSRSGGGVATHTGTTHTSSNLTPGTSYTFQVQGRSSAGNLGPAATVVAQTQPRGSTPGTAPSGALAAPPNLRATGVTRNSVNLAWGPVSGAKTYYLTRQGGGRGLNRPNRTHTSGGLRPNTQYTFLVRAVDSSGRSGPSNVLTVKTKP